MNNSMKTSQWCEFTWLSRSHYFFVVADAVGYVIRCEFMLNGDRSFLFPSFIAKLKQQLQKNQLEVGDQRRSVAYTFFSRLSLSVFLTFSIIKLCDDHIFAMKLDLCIRSADLLFEAFLNFNAEPWLQSWLNHWVAIQLQCIDFNSIDRMDLLDTWKLSFFKK